MLKILTVFSLALLIITPCMAMQNNDTVYFPAVAQGHSCEIKNKKPSVVDQLDMEDRSKINGTQGKALDFCSIEDDLDGRCDAKVCTITKVTNRTPAWPWNESEFNNSKAKEFPDLKQGIYNLTAGSYVISAEKLSNQPNLVINANGKVNVNIKGEYKLQDENMLTINGNVDLYLSNAFKIQDYSVYVNGDVRFFVKGAVDFNSAVFEKNVGSSLYFYAQELIKIQGKSTINGYVYSNKKLELQDDSEVRGRITAKELEMEDGSVINDVIQGAVDKCFMDDFNRKSLGEEFWVVNNSRGGFTPGIVDNRFRLTEAKNDQATSITYLKVFPANNNSFVIEFDQYAYDGSAADGVALVLSDATRQIKPGAYGGPLGYGYKPDADGFNGGWLAIGIDEFGNFIKEGGEVNNSSQIKNTVAIRGKGQGKSGYKLLARKTSLNPTIHSGTNKNRPHRYRISIKFENLSNKAYVTIERRTQENGNYEALIDKQLIDQGTIPEKLLFTITGSTGSSTSVHEIDDTSICAARIEDFEASIDHFRFDFVEKTAQSCSAQAVTLKACANRTCTETYNRPITAELASQPGMKWQGGSEINFIGTTKLFLENIPGAAKLEIIKSIPSSALYQETLCQIGGGGYSASNCTINYSATGKTFKLSIPDAYAGESVTALLEPQEQCQALYKNIGKNVVFTTQALEPAKRVNTPALQLTHEGKEYNLSPDKPTDNIKIQFDAQGQGRVALLYPEAGVNRITVTESATKISGSANLVAVPKGLCVTTNSQCVTNDAKCSPFVAAGADFDLQITAHGVPSLNQKLCTMPALQNYVQGVALSAMLLAPTGGQVGTLGVSHYMHNLTEDTNLVREGKNVVQQSINEVGVFNITANPEGSYHGSTKETAAGTSAAIGRFYPSRFELDMGEVKAKHDGDAKESYMEQPFTVAFGISAVNQAGDIVSNYGGEFAKASATPQSNMSDRLQPALSKVSGPWNKGLLDFNNNDIIFSRANKPDGPYTLDVKLAFKDGESSALTYLYDLRTNKDDQCVPPVCNTPLLGQQKFRYGRLLAATVSQTVHSNASVPLQIQYWDSAEGEKGSWKLFEGDNWTVLQRGEIEFTGKSSSDYKPIFGLGHGDTIAPETQNTNMIKGETKLNVKSPDIAVQIPYRVTVPDWLADGDSNQGQINFGTAKGNSSVIYRREQFLNN